MSIDHSVSALEKFLDFVSTKGYVNKSTAASWKSAATKVLDVADPDERADIFTLDLDSVFRRFEIKNATRYKSESLRVYKSRFTVAINEFKKWVSDPASYKPQGSPKEKKKPDAKDQRRANTNRPAEHATSAQLRDSEAPGFRAADSHTELNAPAGEEVVTLPIPLRPGIQVKISGLPANLSVAEARKISAVIAAYALVDDG